MKDYFGMNSKYGSVVERADISFTHGREKSEEKLKTILKCVYDYADELFDDRLGSHIECLDEALKKTEEAVVAFKKAGASFGKEYEMPDEIRKLEGLAKGNLLLRKGQYFNERFQNASAILRQGSEILIRSWDSNQDTELDMLIRLNIGKYFRDMGKQKQRQYYYDRAIKEFQKLAEQLETENTNAAATDPIQMEGTAVAANKEFRVHLWMDAKMNMGRLQKDLYHLDDAKSCFLGFIRTLLPLCGQQMRASGDAASFYDKGKQLLELFPDDNTDNQDEAGKTQNDKDFTERLKDSLGEAQYRDSCYEELYSEYLIQALVQLGIVCRKERSYKEAETIFGYILEIDKGNVDAINNLGVCAYKRGDISTAENYFGQVIENKDGSSNTNRFAETGLLKCAIRSQKSDARTVNQFHNDTNGEREPIDVEAKITGILAENPEDYEIFFLKGFWLRENHQYLAAQEIFEELYRKNPDLSNGSIGLKAFYNLALCCMEQGKYSQAETILGRICDENSLDLLARLDQAESQMHRGYYRKAQMNYLAVFIGTEYGFTKAEPWRRAQAMRNYGECCLKTERNGSRNFKEAERALRDSMQIEPDNTYAEYLMAVVMHEKILELAKSLAEHEPDASDRNRNLSETHKEKIRVAFLECIERLETIIEKEPEEIRCYSCLVIWSVEYLEMCGWEDPWFEKKVEQCLKYVQNAYSLRACVSLVDFIEHRQSGNPDEEMYRYLSGITIGKKEEGYAAFQNLTDSRFFQMQDDVTKGRILAYLFQLYDGITGIKDLCRYSLNEKMVRKKKPIVHYTKMSTLKILLADAKDKNSKGAKPPEEKEKQPRLRLWNTFYMNDPMEGRLFFELMDDLGTSGDCEKMDHILEKYYCEGDKPFYSSKEQPNNSNVYITSLSSDKDSLMMWIAYSNNADGCAIEFGDDFFDIRYDTGIEMGTSLYTDEDYPLYTVKYIDREEFGKIARGIQNSNNQNSIKAKDQKAEEKELKTICRRMIKLREILKQLDEYMSTRTTQLNSEKEQLQRKRSSQKPLSPEQKRALDKEVDKKLQQKKYDMRQWKVCQESVRKFVADSLNGIRFLFKNTEYRHEKEIRAVRYEADAKVDWTSFEIPRLYVDVDRDIYMNEVQIGPRVDPVEADRISAWLQTTEKVHNVVRSERHYR